VFTLGFNKFRVQSKRCHAHQVLFYNIISTIARQVIDLLVNSNLVATLITREALEDHYEADRGKSVEQAIDVSLPRGTGETQRRGRARHTNCAVYNGFC
jgi:hypothetical protein